MSADAHRFDAGRGRVDGTSAVVVNHQGREYLSACLDALLACGSDLLEVIVVDSGSTDGGQAHVRERYPNVVLLELPGNPGPAAARNLGLRVARGRRVLTVDNDVVIGPKTLAELTRALDQRPDAAAAQARSLVASDQGTIHYDGGAFHYAGLLVLRNFFAPLADAAPAPDGVADVDVVIALCVLQDAERVLAVGGYDEDMSILFEDSDLSWRLRARGERLLLCEREPCRHGAGTIGTSFRADAYPARRVFLHSRNRWILLLKDHRAWTLLLCSPGLVVYELYWLLFATARGHVKAWFAGKWAFLVLVPRVFAERHAVQSTRVVGDRELLRGGPLTLSPQLARRPLARAAITTLDAVLRGWWWLVRPLVR